jgi:ATP synthase protein I
MSAPEPEDLRALGRRIDAARREAPPPPPSAGSIAFRFGTEFAIAVLFGAGLGWLLDHFLHTTPIFIVVMFVLGAAAGIRNVMQAAKELNAEAAKHPAPAVKDKDEDEE